MLLQPSLPPVLGALHLPQLKLRPRDTLTPPSLPRGSWPPPPASLLCSSPTLGNSCKWNHNAVVWQPTPVFLPGESHGQRSLVGYSPRGRKELDTTERLHTHRNICGPTYKFMSFPGGSDVKILPAIRETWVRSLGWKDSWRRKWLPIPVFLPGEFHGQRSLVGDSLWVCKQLDLTEGNLYIEILTPTEMVLGGGAFGK